MSNWAMILLSKIILRCICMHAYKWGLKNNTAGKLSRLTPIYPGVLT